MFDAQQNSQNKNPNPFSCPSDDKIFTFKEEELQRKKDARDRNRSLKLWEKSRPVREGCLRRICETDIDFSSVSINPKFQKKAAKM